MPVTIVGMPACFRSAWSRIPFEPWFALSISATHNTLKTNTLVELSMRTKVEIGTALRVFYILSQVVPGLQRNFILCLHIFPFTKNIASKPKPCRPLLFYVGHAPTPTQKIKPIV
jgi:hypothetical protein